MNCPEDGKPWQDLQERIYNVKPLTRAELAEYDKLAAYNKDYPKRRKVAKA